MLSFLENSVDNHIHCCPHINKRSTNIFEVVEHAENNKMYAIGLMDNFSNTSGYASLIRKYFPNLNLKFTNKYFVSARVFPTNLEKTDKRVSKVIKIKKGYYKILSAKVDHCVDIANQMFQCLKAYK